MRTFIIIVGIILVGYTLIGTDSKVQEIKKVAPSEIKKRGWKILRYEGFQYGSWSKHGGKVWYHVADTLNPFIQYRINVAMWDGELQFYYGQPEVLNRIHLNTLTP